MTEAGAAKADSKEGIQKVFGSGKLKALEGQLISAKEKLESAIKEKTDLAQQLKNAQERIASLEKQLAESEGAELQKKAKDTIVEYEGLKDLYIQKNKEIDANRESMEEGFAREAATKRHSLEEEIQTGRTEHQNLVKETVQTFAGSYRYYMNQIQALMDAMTKAAKETGDSLFAGGPENLKEQFGARILEHLHNDSDALKEEGAGDILLIGQKEPKAEETAEDAAKEAVLESAAEAGAEETGETAAEEAAETVAEAAETVKETAEEAAQAASETVAEAAEAVTETAEEAAEETSDAVKKTEEAAGETVEEIMDTFIDEPVGFVDVEETEA